MSERDTALSQALAAYAGVTSGDALDAALVRSRILQSARAPRRRSLRGLSFALPLVAVLAASAAFAASQPVLRAAVRASFATLLGGAKAPSEAPHRREPGHRAQPSGAQPSGTLPSGAQPFEAEPTPRAAPTADASQGLEAQPPIAIDALPLALPAASSPSKPLPGSARPAVKVSVPTPTPSAPAESNADLDAYRAAHRTHFDGGSPAASLAAWDRYLEDFPAGSFADDARFNRAISLIRLNRLAEARTALTPFAGAPPGSYRQAEAASLLQGLGAAGLRSSK
jgi:hypothetical protein